MKEKNGLQNAGGKTDRLMLMLFLTAVSLAFLFAGMWYYELLWEEQLVTAAFTVVMGLFSAMLLGNQGRQQFYWVAGLHFLEMLIITGFFLVSGVCRPVLAVPMVISLLAGRDKGMVSLVFYGTATVLFGMDPVETLLLYLILGTFLIFAAEKMRTAAGWAAAGLLFIVLYGISYLGLCYYTYGQAEAAELVSGLLGGLLQVLLFGCSLPLLKKHIPKEALLSSHEEKEEPQKAFVKPSKAAHEKKSRKPSRSKPGISLEEMMQPEFPPLSALKERRPLTYKHSVLVSSLASQTAAAIGCDSTLARAGGLYHEAGQGLGVDYVEETIKLLKKYKIPKPVQQIVKEHNAERAKPASKEAAVVMLADTVVSTMERNRKKNSGIAGNMSLLIDRIFQVRIDAGALKRSGLTDSEIEILKETYKNLLGN